MEKLAQSVQLRSAIDPPLFKTHFERTFVGTEAFPAEKTKVAFFNYKHLVNRAVEVFGDEVAASTWLSTPNDDLEGQVPLQVAQKESYDPKVLEAIFVRLEHGIYF